MVALWVTRLKLPVVLFIVQILFIVLFAVLVDYDASASPPSKDNSTSHGNHAANADPISKYYAMFQDVHVMIFAGFGFLMTFLKRYGYSSVGLNFLLAALALQWAVIMQALLHHGHVALGVTNLLTADFACAAVLISFGAVLGKTSPLQLLVMVLMEIPLFSVNEWVGLTILHAVDIGGSMFVHAFGAYFGLAAARVLYADDVSRSHKEGAVYHSDLFAMIGTIFLWLFWPSFNSALAEGDAQSRAVINTYFSLGACVVMTFAISALVDKRGKLDMVHVQNATLAGGVAVGTAADMIIQPYGALLIGCVAGTLSTLGYKYITPFLAARLKVHDTCGVHNLHGMPAILAAVAGAIGALVASPAAYGNTLYRQFPARAPLEGSMEWAELKKAGEDWTGLGRTANQQAGYQALALAVTLGIALVGGAITGLAMRYLPMLGKVTGDAIFEDEYNWNTPEEEEDDCLGIQQAKRDNSHLDESAVPLRAQVSLKS